jgi:hypothetical protein
MSMSKGRIQKPFRDERGYALVTVIVLLVALGFISGGAAIMTANDNRVAGLFTFSNRAGAAAHAGLEHATAHFVTNGSTTGWPVTGTIDGYTYSVTLKPDSFDFGLGMGIVPAHWNSTTGYNGLGLGEPVLVLTSTASSGPYRATQHLRLTAQKLNVQTEAAFSANSGIQLRGNITISGLDHTMTGLPVNPLDTAFDGECHENKPAILMSDADEVVDAQGSVVLTGNASFVTSSPPFVKYGSSTVWHTPEEVLGLPDGALEDYKQSGSNYDANPPDTLSGITYVTDDFGSTGAGSGTINGTGVLIVHNPMFNPREHDPEDPLYDSAKASDPAYAPANLGNINGGVFRGLIIADRVDKINGNVSIYGSVVSLTEIDVNIVGAGTAQIRYSCEALQTISSSLVAPRRLAWMAD